MTRMAMNGFTAFDIKMRYTYPSVRVLVRLYSGGHHISFHVSRSVRLHSLPVHRPHPLHMVRYQYMPTWGQARIFTKGLWLMSVMNKPRNRPMNRNRQYVPTASWRRRYALNVIAHFPPKNHHLNVQVLPMFAGI